MKIIATPIQKWVSNPRTAEFVENTFFAVSVETAMKMVGRPTFIMMDKEADSPAKKKYAAVKEMLYQGICLTLYLSTMKPIKHFFYKIISKGLSNSKKHPENKANIDEFNRQSAKIEEMIKENKATAKKYTQKAERKAFKKQALEKVIEAKEALKNNKNLRIGKGAKELGAIIGSILMLTIAAPQISHMIIHPIMNALGMEDKKADGAKH